MRIIKEGELNREKTVGVKNFISELTKDVEEREKQLAKEEEELAAQMETLAKKAKIRVSHKATKKKTKLADALKNAESIASENSNVFAGGSRSYHSCSERKGI